MLNLLTIANYPCKAGSDKIWLMHAGCLKFPYFQVLLNFVMVTILDSPLLHKTERTHCKDQ